MSKPLTDEQREALITQIALDEFEVAIEMLRPIERVIKSLADTLEEQDKRRRERREQARLHESHLRSLESASGCDGPDTSGQGEEENEQV